MAAAEVPDDDGWAELARQHEAQSAQAEGGGNGLADDAAAALLAGACSEASDAEFLDLWGKLTPEQREAYPAGYVRYAKVRRESIGPGSSRVVQWEALADQAAPEFPWIVPHWLSWHPTIVSGRGGVGKSLLAQQLATALAVGRHPWASGAGGSPGEPVAPLRVLYWACEDDLDEIWRREDRICHSMGIQFGALSRLFVDARCGLDNTLLSLEYGRPMWTPAYGTLAQQVGDLRADVLIVDNIAQVFGGSENDRHHVTLFLNGVFGLVDSRRFCPVILGHLSKAIGSEYAGSTAWENAARMRWYLSDKLPDQPADDADEPAPEGVRYLCKRKANYSVQDLIELEFTGGVLVPRGLPEGPDTGGMMGRLRENRARDVVLAAVRKLAARGIYGSEVRGPGYLPARIAEMRLGEGYKPVEIKGAMNALIMSGELVKDVVGQYANRTPKYGLVEAGRRP